MSLHPVDGGSRPPFVSYLARLNVLLAEIQRLPAEKRRQVREEIIARRPSLAETDRSGPGRSVSASEDSVTSLDCAECGGPIEAGLATLGSIRCMDCRS